MSNLFVPEEEENSNLHGGETGAFYNDVKMDEFDVEDENDPVVEEIPINLNSFVSSTASLNMFQYPGRPRNRPYSDESSILQARIKPRSSFVEVEVPLDTGRFFDESRAEKWTQLQSQALNGVLVDSKGYYLGTINASNELNLIPIDKSVQLRQNFKYIDDIDAKVQAVRKADYVEQNKKPTQIQVVQMTVKSTNENTPRLGGALRANTKVEEEPFMDLNWYDKNYDEVEVIRTNLIDNDVDGKLLVSEFKSREYIDLLVKDTRVDQ